MGNDEIKQNPLINESEISNAKEKKLLDKLIKINSIFDSNLKEQNNPTYKQIFNFKKYNRKN